MSLWFSSARRRGGVAVGALALCALALPARAQVQPTVQVTDLFVQFNMDAAIPLPQRALPLTIDVNEARGNVQALLTTIDPNTNAQSRELRFHVRPRPETGNSVCVQVMLTYSIPIDADVRVTIPGSFFRDCQGDVTANGGGAMLHMVTGQCPQSTLVAIPTSRFFVGQGQQITFTLRGCSSRQDASTNFTSVNQAVSILYFPPGACCDGAGMCTMQTQTQCTGDYQGDNTTCATPCPIGACCSHNGDCALTGQAGCAGPRTYRGNGTVCGPNPCPPPPRLYAILLGGTGAHHANPFLDPLNVEAALTALPGVDPANIYVVNSKFGVLQAWGLFASHVKERDMFLFFYSGHGGFAETAGHLDEPPVSLGLREAFWCGCQTSTGDNFLAIDPDDAASFYYDDELADLFRAFPNTDRVSKLAVISACFGGGFWGLPGNGADSGDLDKVPNSGLIAAGDGGHFGYSILNPGDITAATGCSPTRS